MRKLKQRLIVMQLIREKLGKRLRKKKNCRGTVPLWNREKVHPHLKGVRETELGPPVTVFSL